MPNPGNCLQTTLTNAVADSLHGMSQPLTVLRGSMELALLEGLSNEEYREVLELALCEVSRLANGLRHVRQLVALQKNPADIESVNLAEALRHAVHVLSEPFVDAKVQIRMETGNSMVPAVASRQRIHEALVQVLALAFAALPGGGTVNVTISGGAELPALRFEFIQPKGNKTSIDISSIHHGIELTTLMLATLGGEFAFDSEAASAAISFLQQAEVTLTSNQQARTKGDPVHV